MSFFDSELVRAEMTKISELQEEIYKSVFAFASMSKTEKVNHIDKLQELLEVQKVLYMRLSLSDDPEAVKMKEQIMDSALMMGLPKGTDMNTLFANMTKMISLMRDQLDAGDLP
jgi:hypothetical protein|tara:strand:- start:564 stop:905 length:342 start_codon:yes stop_codon:yes gene_type:complete